MKQSPSEKDLMRNLGPSRFSAEGFLGTDARPVDEIISEDMHHLGESRISKEGLVRVLKAAYDKAKKAFGAGVVICPGVTACFYESMGRISSPFPGDGVFEKGEAVVTDKETGDALIITRLGIHLIEKHNFFQGKENRYRIDPDKALRMFRLS